jgi:1,4-dihydroxy-2-naphthoate octaprenyltransferase
MNGIKNFLSFVEIRTKLASIIPFGVGLAYALYVTGRINARAALLFFVADLLFDMSVTAINNTIDKRAEGARAHYSLGGSLALIFGMSLPALAIGFYLAYVYGLPVLLAGAVCVVTGVFYTFGPAPISRSPYGELASGVVEGGFLPFIVYAVSAPDSPLFTISRNGWWFFANVNLLAALKFTLAVFPLMAGIANIMLSNNICDMEQDMANRYTMPRHIGRKRAIVLFEVLTYAQYAAIAAAALAGVVPTLCLAVLPTLIVVAKRLKAFRQRQVKPDTFVISINNFVLVNVLYGVSIFIGALT